MNSRSLVNLLLLIFLLISSGWYIYIKNQPVEVSRLSSLQLKEISNIRIPKNKGTDIVFNKSLSEKGEPVWHMLSPYQIKAHQFRINTLLSLTQTPVEKLYPASELDLADYALDKPRASIIFDSTKISFGKSNTLNNKRYILSENNMALLLDQTYPLVSAQPPTFVNLNLLPDNDSINSIILPGLTLYKNQNNTWKLSPGENITTDQIQGFIENWNSAEAFSVHRFLERKQLGTIKIQTDKTIITFVISDDEPWLILARPDLGIEYHLDKSFNHKLLTPFMKSDSNA